MAQKPLWIDELETYIKQVVEENNGKIAYSIEPEIDGDPNDVGTYTGLYLTRKLDPETEAQAVIDLLLGPIIYYCGGDIQEAKKALKGLQKILDLYDLEME